MKLKELKRKIYGSVVLYEEARKISEDYPKYEDLYVGECKDIPLQLQEREIFVISASKRQGEPFLDIELLKEKAVDGLRDD